MGDARGLAPAETYIAPFLAPTHALAVRNCKKKARHEGNWGVVAAPGEGASVRHNARHAHSTSAIPHAELAASFGAQSVGEGNFPSCAWLHVLRQRPRSRSVL